MASVQEAFRLHDILCEKFYYGEEDLFRVGR